MRYRCVATSEIGFVQQVACNYLPHGYWFFVQGQIPAHKDPKEVDEKLVDKYGIDVSRATRCRRKKNGLANLHYLRCERNFVILATHGKHQFFADESACIRDARELPILFAGYSISSRRGQYRIKRSGDFTATPDGRWRSRVQVCRPVYLDWLAYFEEAACRLPVDRLSQQLYLFPYEPYAPVRKQMLNLVRVVNGVRKQRGRSVLDARRVLRYRRRIVQVFEDRAGGGERRDAP